MITHQQKVKIYEFICFIYTFKMFSILTFKIIENLILNRKRKFLYNKMHLSNVSYIKIKNRILGMKWKEHYFVIIRFYI